MDSEGAFTPKEFKVWLVSAENLTGVELEAYQGGLKTVTEVRPLADEEIQKLAKC